MYFLLTPLTYLPLAELIGFIVIGGRIGLGMTLIWIMCSTILGFSLLKTGASGAFSRAKRDEDDELFAVREVFDSFCLMIAALLLIFPGFISDFIAIPFIISPFRSWMFQRSHNNPDSFLRRFTRDTQNFRHATKRPPPAPTDTVIEAEYKRIDDKTED